jgi:hypothetical protein
MGMPFPSSQFDDAVAAVCHGVASDTQLCELNQLLLSDGDACDEYLLRIELHSRLATSPDFFAGSRLNELGLREETELPQADTVAAKPAWSRRGSRLWVCAAAACAALLIYGQWGSKFRFRWPVEPEATPSRQQGATSTAVAMLNRAIDPLWNPDRMVPQIGAPLEPGTFDLQSGLAEVVFYSGARLTIAGPAVFRIVSPFEALFQSGRLTADVPEQASGFRILTPQGNIDDVRAVFGLRVTESKTELHVLKGGMLFHSTGDGSHHELNETSGMIAERSRPVRRISADATDFPSIVELQEKSTAAAAHRYDRWRSSREKLHRDPSLLVHFDFEGSDPRRWQVSNVSPFKSDPEGAAIVGCRWTEGRWPGKAAIEFLSVNDRVRLCVPGQYESLTLATWVRVQGLDRELNSLLMCEGFEPGSLHWLIRHDGVLGLTVIERGSGRPEIIASPPVLTLDLIGRWLHLAVVLDGETRRVTHYLNGVRVSESPLRSNPPFHLGVAELGNWSTNGFPGHDAALIRNFSGAMDEFCLFGRALADEEIHRQFREGSPQSISSISSTSILERSP